MIHGKYTDAHIERANRRGKAHEDLAQSRGWRNYGMDMPPEQTAANHNFGELGVILVAEHFELPCDDDPKLRSYDDAAAPDLGIIEVRSRRIEYNRPLPDLTIREDDRLRLPVVLVRIDTGRREYWIVGWLCGWQAIERPTAEGKYPQDGEKVWCPIHKVYYVRPPYWSVRSLEQWIAQGHPPHYAPEKYRK